MTTLLHLAGPLLTLAGVVLGIWGTLLMCRAYHPFSTGKVLLHLLGVVGKFIRGNWSGARESIESASEFSTLNQENRLRTLTGVYVLVFSFLLQTAGAMLVLIDSCLASQTPGKP